MLFCGQEVYSVDLEVFWSRLVLELTLTWSQPSPDMLQRVGFQDQRCGTTFFDTIIMDGITEISFTDYKAIIYTTNDKDYIQLRVRVRMILWCEENKLSFSKLSDYN